MQFKEGEIMENKYSIIPFFKIAFHYKDTDDLMNVCMKFYQISYRKGGRQDFCT